jgi:hypothetical protein
MCYNVCIVTNKGQKDMMLFTGYTSKKELKAALGTKLVYQETSMFGPEYVSTGSFVGAHRPRVTGLKGREFFAKVTMKNNLIAAVE